MASLKLPSGLTYDTWTGSLSLNPTIDHLDPAKGHKDVLDVLKQQKAVNEETLAKYKRDPKGTGLTEEDVKFLEVQLDYLNKRIKQVLIQRDQYVDLDGPSCAPPSWWPFGKKKDQKK